MLNSRRVQPAELARCVFTPVPARCVFPLSNCLHELRLWGFGAGLKIETEISPNEVPRTKWTRNTENLKQKDSGQDVKSDSKELNCTKWKK